MITEFVLENKTTRDKVSFGQSPAFDYIYKSDGLDWGTALATHNRYSYPGQVGDTISSTVINGRDISITAYVFYWLSQSEKNSVSRNERVQYCYDQILKKKDVLSRLVNPDNFVKITVGSYYIEGKPSSPVIYGKTEEDNNVYFCKFIISIYCANPMFRKVIGYTSDLAERIPRFYFPITFPRDRGILMTLRRNYLMVGVDNEGNVSVGGKITIIANGDVKNPSVEKIDTGETIKVNKTLHAGEVVEINTVDGSDRGIVGIYKGVTSNYFKYWSFDNTWFKFDPGLTLLGYSTQDGSESSMQVLVEINPEKFNLENM